MSNIGKWAFTKKPSPSINCLDDFKRWVFSNFQVDVNSIEVDGKILRVASPEEKSNGNSFAAQCFMTESGVVLGWANDWRRGIPVTHYKPEKEFKLSRSQVVEIQDERIKRAEAKKILDEKNRLQLIKKFETFKPANQDHDYLVKKGVQCPEAMIDNTGRLALPITDNNGEIHGIQYLSASGKKIINGTYAGGKSVYLKGNDKKIVVCEGISTGLTIRELTGYTVMCALSCGCIDSAVKVAKSNGSKDIVIASDNDWAKKDNVGLRTATLAAKKHGVEIVTPEFAGQKGSDWNDLASINKEEAKKQLKTVTAKKSNGILDAIYNGSESFEFKPCEFVIEDFYQVGETNLVLANGGVGKSLLTLLQAVSIVTGRNLIGQKIAKVGPVVYYNAEDPINTIQLRLEAIIKHYKISREEINDLHIISGREDKDYKGYRVVLASLDSEKKVVHGADFDNFVEVLNIIRPVALFVDPLIKLHKGANENSNEDMEEVMNICSDLNNHCSDMAIIVVHHVGKATTDQLRKQDNIGRGASAAFDHSRSCWLITPLTNGERKKADDMGIDPNFLIRVDCKKASNFTKPINPLWLNKARLILPNIPDTKGNPTKMVCLENTNFSMPKDGRREEISEESCQAGAEWLYTVLKNQGPMSQADISDLLMNDESELSSLASEYWGLSAPTIKRKISSILKAPKAGKPPIETDLFGYDFEVRKDGVKVIYGVFKELT